MRTTSIAAVGLTGLVGVFCFTSTFKASGSETVSPDASTSNSSGEGTPVIQFETTFFDFGKIIAPGKVSGVFKFKNVGNGVLELAPPEPSCGCTDAKVKPDKLAPGESGEISYTINLDHAMGQVQKHITVHSNDPKTPEIDLTMQLDYTPLYDLDPKLLRLQLPPDKDEAQGTFTVVRNDGKPLGIERLATSQKWADATWDSSFKPEASSAQINVTVHRPANPLPMMMANVQLWANGQTNPVQSLFLSCEIQGELSATPSQMYWVIPDFGNSVTNYPAEALTRTVKLKSILGKPVKIENVADNIKGMSAQVVPDQTGTTFDLVLKFAELPKEFTSGNVTIETSSASLPKLKVPVIVSVAPKG